MKYTFMEKIKAKPIDSQLEHLAFLAMVAGDDEALEFALNRLEEEK